MMGAVAYVRGRAVRWVDDDWPGWVEVQFVAADGTTVRVIDKMPIFDGGEGLVPGTPLPVPVRVAADVLTWEPGPEDRRVAVVALRHHVQDEAGRSTFRVAVDAIISDD